MNKEQIEYYKEMWNRDRLIALVNSKNKLIGVVSFFFVKNNLDKIRNRDSWTLIKDEKEGHIVYIDQLIMNKGVNFSSLSFNIWSFIKKHFKEEFKNVNTITWNRWKNNKRYYYTRRIRNGLHTSCAG